MAGHSKWANIKHRKAGQDAKRGKVFTKLIRELTVAAKEGGGDPDANPRLRTAIDKALSNNMKRDTVDKAISRGSGQNDGADFEQIRYEGYGPRGIAMIVDCLTDNRQRTVAEVRHAFSKAGGNLGTDGSVSYMFDHKGVFTLHNCDEESVFDIALQNGADDVSAQSDGSVEVSCEVSAFNALRQALQQTDFFIQNAELTFIASIENALSLEDTQKVLTLVDRLEDLDDVQQVYTNLALSEDILQQLDTDE